MYIRLPDIAERAKGVAGRHGTQAVDARMAMVWPADATELDLLTKCLIAFQDRFYIDEIAIVIFAAINRILGFLVLDFAGNVEEFSGHLAVVQIMTRLADMFPNSERPA